MGARVVLSGEVESEFLDVVEHVGMVLADPSGSALNRKVLHLLKPLIAVRTIFQALAQGQRTNPAAESLRGLQDDKILLILSENEGSLKRRYSCTHDDVLIMIGMLHKK